MDLYLVQEYAYSPAGLMCVQFLTNCTSVYLTPSAKLFLQWVRSKKYHGKAGVIVLWSISMTFLAIIILPGVPWWAVGLCIIMRNSLNTCTKAYNRAKLANYLPHDKVSKYMVWDSLNKANQGGIAIFGAQLVHLGGYRLCFFSTLCIMIIRLLIYLSFVVRQHLGKKARRQRRMTAESASATPVPWSEAFAKDGMKPRANGNSKPWGKAVEPVDEKRIPLLFDTQTAPNLATGEEDDKRDEIEGELGYGTVNSPASSGTDDDYEESMDHDARMDPDEVPSHMFRPKIDYEEPEIDTLSSESRILAVTTSMDTGFSESYFSEFERTLGLGRSQSFGLQPALTLEGMLPRKRSSSLIDFDGFTPENVNASTLSLSVPSGLRTQVVQAQPTLATLHSGPDMNANNGDDEHHLV